MNITKGEFSQFNLKSRIYILLNKGILLSTKKISKIHEVRLFLLYGFYVTAIYNRPKNEIQSAEPVLNEGLLNVYLQ